MSEVKGKIQKTGKVLKSICLIIRILIFLSMGLVLFGMIGTMFSDFLMEQCKEIFVEEGIYDITSGMEFLKGLSEKNIILIGGFIHIITRGVLIFYLFFFDRVLSHMIEGEQPFTAQMAKRLRGISYTMLIFILYNPLMGVTLFLVGLLFSYLFEYGAYLQEKADETNRIQEEMIVSFAEITENKSEQTGHHVKRVAEYSKILAQEMGLPEEEVDQVRIASMMHDIGKLMIPAEILEKPGKLSDEEFAEIKKHTDYGGMLLNSVEGDVMKLAKTIAVEHHERVDGHGYPGGKSGNQISIEGKIVAVADVYDALTSKRSYKEAWDENRAYDEIIKGSGTQFDASVVEAFIKAYSKINAVRAKFAD